MSTIPGVFDSFLGRECRCRTCRIADPFYVRDHRYRLTSEEFFFLKSWSLVV